MKIAITGGIAAGKSTVAALLATKLPNYIHLNIDNLVQEVYNSLDNNPLVSPDYQFIESLRIVLIRTFGSYRKSEIMSACLGNPELLSKLEDIFTPIINKGLLIALLEKDIVIEFPLLFEKNFQDEFEYIINVDAPESVRKERAMQRPGMTPEKFDFIVSRQKANREKSHLSFINERQEDLDFYTDVAAITALTQNKKTAIVSGSFDPITNGHLHLIDEGLKLMDFVVVAIAQNPNKKGMFMLPERLDLVNKSIDEWVSPGLKQSIYVTVMPSNETLVGVADAFGAKYIIRGLRNTTDFEYERQIDLVQRRIAPWIETIYLMTPRELTEVSSSMVKSIHGLNGWENIAKPYIPTAVLNAMKSKLENQNS